MAYTKLLMEPTVAETVWRQAVENAEGLQPEEKQRRLKKLDEEFWYRRLINADYFKQLKALLLTNDYL